MTAEKLADAASRFTFGSTDDRGEAYAVGRVGADHLVLHGGAEHRPDVHVPVLWDAEEGGGLIDGEHLVVLVGVAGECGGPRAEERSRGFAMIRSKTAATCRPWRGDSTLTITMMDNKLSYMRTEAPLLAPIFRSDGQARLLSTLLLAGDELSVTDVAERADLAYPTAHREVARLIDAGILVERQVGRTRLIRGNPDSPLAAPLREILTVISGPVVLLAEELERIDGIRSAFLYGSFAARLLGVDGPAPHDIDVMVVGAPDVDEIFEACTRVEAAVHRPVNPTILSVEEFKAESGFLDTVRSSSIVPVMGEQSWRSLR